MVKWNCIVDPELSDFTITSQAENDRKKPITIIVDVKVRKLFNTSLIKLSCGNYKLKQACTILYKILIQTLQRASTSARYILYKNNKLAIRLPVAV